MFNLKQQEIYARAKHPEHGGELENPDFRVGGANPVCGDELTLTGQISKDGKISSLRHSTRACAVCTAAADQLADLVVGKTLQEARNLSVQAVTEQLGIELSPTRLKCALLPLETLKQAEV